MLVDTLIILGIMVLGLILFPYILILALLVMTLLLGLCAYVEYWIVVGAHKLLGKQRRK